MPVPHLFASRLLPVVLAAILGGLAFGCSATAPLPPRAIALNDEGAAALAAGDLTVAEARVALALEYNPRFTEAWVNLGLVELRRGNVDLARKHLRKARQLNPDLPSPHHGLGLVADKEGDGAEAEAHYRAALKVDPGFVPARANLARRLFARRAFEEARSQYVRLIEVEPTEVEGWAGLVECLLQLERVPEADEVLAQAEARFGRVPSVAILVARRLLRGGEPAEAARVLLPVTDDALASRRAAAWAWTAVADVAQGKPEAAVDAAHRALALDRAQPVATYALNAALAATAP